MSVLSQDLQQYRARIDEVVKDLHNLTAEIGHRELAQTLSELRNRIHEPFMFVIVGEVKAGKSSFINALLETDKEICKVSPAPMTDTIQQIVFGEKEEIIVVNPHLKKLLYPLEILKEIAIVDTPGTNTIVAHHQEITEGFIPAADLIVFVFEAKNPYRQSAWDFLDFIHSEWRRKIIFVLQQKDLMPPADLAVNERGLSEFAQKKGIVSPQIFAVSAKDDLEGRKEQSNLETVRAYIRANITGGQAGFLKLQNNAATSHNIAERIERGLTTRREQYQADTVFRADIKQTLDSQELKSGKQVDMMVENLLAGYDKITLATERELDRELSFFSLVKRTITSMFSSESSPRHRLEALAKNLQQQLSTDLSRRLNEGVNEVADSIQQMAKVIDLKIKNSQTALRNDQDIFADIADRRSNVLRELQAAFANFMANTENFAGADVISANQSIAPNIATGGGMAIVGIILAAVTNGAVFDITGGILSSLGLLFAGVTASVSRGKILNGYRAETAKGRERLHTEVDEKLKSYIKKIKQKIDSNFAGFDALLDTEQQQIQQLEGRFAQIDGRLATLRQELAQWAGE
ncbi:MAG: dynamin family protein [Bernardetiaceae bacterium]|nr:dynamin family protein [Bernardetiaceae bacterium]